MSAMDSGFVVNQELTAKGVGGQAVSLLAQFEKMVAGISNYVMEKDSAGGQCWPS